MGTTTLLIRVRAIVLALIMILLLCRSSTIYSSSASVSTGAKFSMESLWESGVSRVCLSRPDVAASSTQTRELQAKDKFWKHLTHTERTAAELLGWTQHGWNDGDPTPMEKWYWAAWLKGQRNADASPMNESHRAAARALGYSQSVWDFGIVEDSTLVALRSALLEKVEKQQANLEAPQAMGWNRPTLRGLLDVDSDVLHMNDRNRLVQWAKAALKHYLQTTYDSQRSGTAIVKITDSWLSVGREEDWTGAHVIAHTRRDIVGHLFIDCQAHGTCSLHLNDPRPRADAQTSSNFKAGVIHSPRWQSVRPPGKDLKPMPGCAILFPGVFCAKQCE